MARAVTSRVAATTPARSGRPAIGAPTISSRGSDRVKERSYAKPRRGPCGKVKRSARLLIVIGQLKRMIGGNELGVALHNALRLTMTGHPVNGQ
jgi:hypothetical protein